VKPATSDHAALTIAGSDPSGGAGIQADLKTFTALGVYGGAVITCLTAQNSLGVRSTQPVEPDFVREQARLVLDDLPVTHIKTGMIGTGAVANAVGDILRDFEGIVVCDPVFRASGGKDLLEADGFDAFQRQVVGNATFITPNVFELEHLSGLPCRKEEEVLQAGLFLLEKFSNLAGVILTGGHLGGPGLPVKDYFIRRTADSKKPQTLGAEHERIRTQNTHGTGCTFASAFTAYHLLTNDADQSFYQAVAFMDQVIRKSADLSLGKGNGPLAHHLYRP
jgi:hydroxymethylpyrimidine kinase/phosphomethylpyrimidine kinase